MKLDLGRLEQIRAWDGGDGEIADQLAVEEAIALLQRAGIFTEARQIPPAAKLDPLEKLRDPGGPGSPARVLFLIESNARLRVGLQQAIEVLEALNDDEINVELLPMLKAALHD